MIVNEEGEKVYVYDDKYLEYLSQELSNAFDINAPKLCQKNDEVYFPESNECKKVSFVIEQLNLSLKRPENLEDILNEGNKIKSQYNIELEEILDSNINLISSFLKIEESEDIPEWLKSKIDTLRTELLSNVRQQIEIQEKIINENKQIMGSLKGEGGKFGNIEVTSFEEIFKGISIAENALLKIGERRIDILSGKLDGSLIDEMTKSLREMALLFLKNPQNPKQISNISLISRLIDDSLEYNKSYKNIFNEYEKGYEGEELKLRRKKLIRFFDKIKNKFYQLGDKRKDIDPEIFCNNITEKEEDKNICFRFLSEYKDYSKIIHIFKKRKREYRSFLNREKRRIENPDIEEKSPEAKKEQIEESQYSKTAELAVLFIENGKIKKNLERSRQLIMQQGGFDKEGFKKIFDQLKKVESREERENICRRTFNQNATEKDGKNELEIECLTYLGEWRNLQEIKERSKILGAIPKDSTVIANTGQIPIPKNSELYGVLSDLSYLRFDDSDNFFSFIANKINEIEGFRKRYPKEAERTEKLFNRTNLEKTLKDLIMDPSILGKYQGLRSYKSVLAEYLAIIEYISENESDQIIFPSNPNQAYFDFISVNRSSGKTKIFPVKIGDEMKSDPGREADTSGLLRLIGELPEKIKGESEEAYQQRLKEKLEKLIEENNPKLRKLIDNSELCVVTTEGNVLFRPDIEIKPSEGIIGKRTKDGVIETKHKYKIIANTRQKNNFSSSIQKAIHLLKSPSFSEAGFKKFMHENKLWQAI